MSHPVASHPVATRRPVGRTAPSWLLTVWAALAALAVCVVAVFYTPIEPPAAWRSAEFAVVSVGRHALSEDSLGL